MTHINAVRLGLAGPDEIRAHSNGEVTRPAAFDPDTGAPVVGGLFCPRIFGTPALLREYESDAEPSACRTDDHDWTRDAAADPPSATCERCGLRLTAIGSADAQRERFGHVELAAPVPHPWFRGTASREATLLRALPILPAGLRLPVERRPRGEQRDSSGGAAIPDLNERYRRVIVANGACARLLAGDSPKAERQTAELRLADAVTRLFSAIEARFTNEAGRLRAAFRSAALDEPGSVDAPMATVVPDPALGLDQCGLPRSLALRLFAPLAAGRMVEAGQADDLIGAGRAVERAAPHALAALEQVVADAVVVLSRPPAHRRRNVLAFAPALIAGEDVRLHPLSALALGVDEAHDRVTVRAALAPAARQETLDRLLPSANLLDPASGQLAFEPAADVVLGCYYLTVERYGAKGQERRFGSWADAIRAYDLRSTLPEAGIDLQAGIVVRMRRDVDGTLWEYDPAVDVIDPNDPDAIQADMLEMVWTTVGRLILFKMINDTLRDHGGDPLPFENKRIDKGGLKTIATTVIQRSGNRQAAAVLEAITALGLHYATSSGTSLGCTDVATPPTVPPLLAQADAEVAQLWKEYDRGFLSDDERYTETVEIWIRAKDHVTNAVDKALDLFGPLAMMAMSGARGNIQQITAMMGMPGLQANALGVIHEVPIRSNLGRGLRPHEYTMRAVGARMLRITPVFQEPYADDLLRRLVAALGDIVISEEDCGTEDGIWIDDLTDPYRQRQRLDWLLGRYLVADAVDPSTGLVEVPMDEDGTILTEIERDQIAQALIKRVFVRSPLTCKSRHGICQRCYGWDPARRAPVEVGTEVGVIAAQAIAVPAASMTGRVFSYGRPRVTRTRTVSKRPDRVVWRIRRLEDLLEARRPTDAAILSEIDGRVRVDWIGDDRWLTVVSSERSSEEHDLPPGYTPAVQTGDWVWAGQDLATHPSGPSLRSRLTGTIEQVERQIVVAYEAREELAYRVPSAGRIRVEDGRVVSAGDKLTAGEVDPAEALPIWGRVPTEAYVVGELDYVYDSEGFRIDVRHVEVVVRQLFRMMRLSAPGDTTLLPGQLIDEFVFWDENRGVLEADGDPPTAQRVVLGLSALAGQADGFLARAAFGSARQVLPEAALAGTIDRLLQPTARIAVGARIQVPVRAEGDRPVIAEEEPDPRPASTLSDGDPGQPTVLLSDLDFDDIDLGAFADDEPPVTLADLDLGEIDDTDLSLPADDPPRQG